HIANQKRILTQVRHWIAPEEQNDITEHRVCISRLRENMKLYLNRLWKRDFFEKHADDAPIVSFSDDVPSYHSLVKLFEAVFVKIEFTSSPVSVSFFCCWLI